MHPLEVYWSQSEQLPVDEERLGDFRIDEHPQYAGLKNLSDLRNEYDGQSPGFSKCFGLTIEPGISNVKGNSLYYVGSLDWRLLERKLQQGLGAGFRLSDVSARAMI